ncbi:hypothetical protein [Sideroxydans lithotrophicus]|uniref:Uncharacterized protein n=1 Tax=Sideroxydans lithotrophicus (strain ES-1) TaxID=580332 RepID=D5CUL3_SIDLE|nr:hypothetical protein [Sideroxydans lithotrophicus]ADE12400.1 conserved hypothetical protein [Sideroxydans lithotrophicus ES-1]
MTSVWFTKNLGDAMLADAALTRLVALFALTYGKANSSPKIAVFVRHESEGRLHCEVKAYLSPDAAAMAKLVDAAPCKRPSTDGLSLLAGTNDCWPALFPESGKRVIPS